MLILIAVIAIYLLNETTYQKIILCPPFGQGKMEIIENGHIKKIKNNIMSIESNNQMYYIPVNKYRYVIAVKQELCNVENNK
jgi:hypothetical protein